MASKHPVVVYGASGYTGRLICEYLRELRVPFIAAGRNEDRLKEVVDRIPGVADTGVYEVAAVEHTVEALTSLFEGAKVVLNTVGPFADLGHEVVEACLATGCHYLDTTGEQNWILSAQERHGAGFEEAGLLLAPGIAQMYTTGEIAAEIALEQPGYETLDTVVLWKGAPTTASTETIFSNLLSTPYKLEGGEYVAWEGTQLYEVSMPGQHETALTLPWGGTSLPVWYKDDPRVNDVSSLGGVYNRGLMQVVLQIAQAVEEAIRPLPESEQRAKLDEMAAANAAPMPPREMAAYNRSMDSVHATGPLKHAHVVLRGNSNYKQTGLLQAYGALHLLRQRPNRVGFASGCQAFGHRRLLDVLQQYGLSGEPIVVRD
ncbi:unannotated protein [freshwater metagenome]|uniref:Unannotated protein n=1 Tax=freshwater metagenome TaxID=449393 RepID=A0A6J7H1Z9_9ZZZZ|nr:saccharopine dehydrogenase [Actinomycetota bacterium]